VARCVLHIVLLDCVTRNRKWRRACQFATVC